MRVSACVGVRVRVRLDVRTCVVTETRFSFLFDFILCIIYQNYINSYNCYCSLPPFIDVKRIYPLEQLWNQRVL